MTQATLDRTPIRRKPEGKYTIAELLGAASRVGTLVPTNGDQAIVKQADRSHPDGFRLVVGKVLLACPATAWPDNSDHDVIEFWDDENHGWFHIPVDIATAELDVDSMTWVLQEETV